MTGTLQFDPDLTADPLTALGQAALYCLAYMLCGLVPIVFLLFTYYLLTLPMRRNERLRAFLDLLELGLKEGSTPERTILNATATGDSALGSRFHRLAAELEKGSKLVEALARVPRLVPPQLLAMLRTGERIGDVAKVLPACRQILIDGVSQVRGALNYLLILAFVITPFTLMVPIVINVAILPKFKEVYAGLAGVSEEATLPGFTRFVFDNSRGLMCIQIGLVLLVWMLMLAYIGGPRLRGWVGRFLPGVPDRIFYWLPWRRKRLQRDFSSLLSVLLDSEVPEIEAVTLAAQSTANCVVRRRAEVVCRQLNDGVKLTSAIRSVDDSGELQWRLANALYSGGGFIRALAGWHEALDAKAFQLEQAAAQITTSALVLLNGAIVASVVLAVFLPLIHLINVMVLW